MESSYMGGLDGSDPLGKAVIWSRTEEQMGHLDEHLRQQDQEQVPFSPLPTRSSSTSTATSTTTEDTETATWDDLGLDSNTIGSASCFHVLYTGHGSPPAKSRVRQSLAQAMSSYFTTIQQQRRQQMWRQQQQQQQQQQSSTKSLPQQRFNVVNSEALNTDTYEDNGLALWETDATWTLPSMSILLSSLMDTDGADGDISDNDHDSSLCVHYLPQNLYSDLLPQLEVDNRTKRMNPPIDLVIYFCNQRNGPLEQDFTALSKLQLPVLPLIIDSLSSSKPAPIPAPPTSDPDYPPSLSSSFSSSSSQIVTIQTKPLSTTKQSSIPSPLSPPDPTTPSSSSWALLLRKTLASYLQQYHIHCVNVTEIHPEIPGFITNVTESCPDGALSSSLCHIMSANEIMHIDQFANLDTRVIYKLIANIRKYNEKWHQVKQQNQKWQQPWTWLVRCISGDDRRQRRRSWQSVLLLWLMVFLASMVIFGILQSMHMLTWIHYDNDAFVVGGGGDDTFTSADTTVGSPPPAPTPGGDPLISGSRGSSDTLDGQDKKNNLVMEEQNDPLVSALPHITMAPGYEFPDADMYHHLTLKMTANSMDMDADRNKGGNDHRSSSSGNGSKGEARQVVVINQAQLVWDQGGVWTLTKTDYTAHVPSPCKMNWDTDMNLSLWINTNNGDGDGGYWQTTSQVFTLPWVPCHQHQQEHQHTYYPHGDIETGLDSDVSTAYFTLTPYQHDVLHQWWLQLKSWTKNSVNGLVGGVKRLQTMTSSLYVYLMQ